MILPRFLTIFLTSCVFATFAGADTVKLKSGELLKGTILSEDADSITIEVQVSKGIKDERKVAKSEVDSFAKDDPAAKAWEEVTKNIPTADLMGTSDYDGLISRVESFIRTHPTSMRAGEGRRLAEALKEERLKVAAGGMKIDGGWITAEQYQREKYWVDGKIALAQMVAAGKNNRLVEALRQFEKIEASYPGTTVLAKAIEEAKVLLKRYGIAVGEAMANQPLLVKQRESGLAALPVDERKVREDAQKLEQAALLQKIQDEIKSGTKWLSLDPYDADDLKKTQVFIEKELVRISGVDTSAAAANESLLRQIDVLLNDGRLDSAADLIKQATAARVTSPYLKSLDDRVRSEVARISEEKKSADAARAEAEKRARAVTPVPNLPKPVDEEEAPEKTAMNPVAKAVAESDLGKRVNESAPKVAEEAEESGPAPVVEPATSEEATSSEPVVTPPQTSSSSGKKASSGGMTGILYGLAALLVLVLVGLLVFPALKKKPVESVAVEESKPEDGPEDGNP